MKRIACIYNGGSGSATDKQQIKKAFNSLGLTVDFLSIKSGETVLARKLNKQTYASVVAAGGDGTVRLTAQLAVKAKLTLGILPLGTLNHFAKDLGLPLNLEDAAKVIANGSPTQADYCTVNDRLFVNNASLGVYPSIVIGRDKISKRWGKWLAATKAFIATLRANHNLQCSVTTPAGNWDYVSPLVFVGNNKYSVDKTGLSGREKLNGGRMFLYVVRATHRRRLVLLGLLSLFGIRLRRAAYIKQTNGPIIIKSAKSSTVIALDGEVFDMHFPLQFEMYSRQLVVLNQNSA